MRSNAEIIKIKDQNPYASSKPFNRTSHLFNPKFDKHVCIVSKVLKPGNHNNKPHCTYFVLNDNTSGKKKISFQASSYEHSRRRSRCI